jgi:hypothetical protein
LIGLPSALVPSPKASAAPTKGAIAGAVLLFLAGFILCAALLHLLVGNTLALYGAERSEKLEILKRSGFAYSSAVLGSSHVHQGFDPRAFDATLAGTPLAVRSFNLGVDGGVIVEERVMALDLLDHLKPPPGDKPCLVILEANATPTFDLYFTSHPRQINILDAQSLRLILAFPATGYLTRNRIHHRIAAFTAAFYHAIDMGMLSNRIFRPSFNEVSIRKETADDQRGIHFIPSDIWERSDLADAWGKRRFPPGHAPATLAEGHRMLMEELHRAPNGDRVQLAWVVMPLMRDLETYDVYPATAPTSFGDVPIFDMGRPDLYPELYDRSLWTDSQHLNVQGAKLFSQLLAQQLLAWSHNHPVHGCGG